MLWGFLVLQIILYPIVAACVERLLFGTASKGHRFVQQKNASEPTVRLLDFSKTYVIIASNEAVERLVANLAQVQTILDEANFQDKIGCTSCQEHDPGCSQRPNSDAPGAQW